MELPTEEEFTVICSEHLWTFTMESDLNKFDSELGKNV